MADRGRDTRLLCEDQFMKKSVVTTVAVLLFAASLMPTSAHAEGAKRVGGHVGFVVPLVSRSAGQTTTVADDFVFGLPTGFGLKKFGRFVVDFEVVPGFQNDPRDVSLELHPGVVMGVSDGLAAGLRLAVDVEGNAWGFTPLLNRRIYDASTHSLFAELVVPVRFVDGTDGTRSAVGLGVHVGIGF
jgi:hypothetical protein